MSLETTVAALVDASNKLTAAVTGKVAEIDLKVKAATDAVPALVRSMSTQQYFVDAVDGLDTNEGTQAKPFKTANAAQAKIVSGAQVTVYFKARQTHEVNLILRSGRLVLASYAFTDVQDSTQRATIKPALGGVANDLQDTYGLGVSSGQIFLYGLNLMADVQTALGLTNVASVIRYADSHVTVMMNWCDVVLGNIPFATMYTGYSARDIYMSSTKVSIKAGYEATAKLLKNLNGTNPTVRIEAHASTLVGVSGGWASLLPTKGAENYLTNLSI